MRDLISEIGRFLPNEDTPLRNGHLHIADRNIFPFFPFIVITIGWSWILLLVSRFFIFIFTLLFIITRGLSTLNRVDLGRNLRIRRSRGGSLGLLGRFSC